MAPNMKKQGKMYSFEDQKWDAEMKLELEKKKLGGEKGGGEEKRDVRRLVKEAKLSQKQKVGHYTERGEKMLAMKPVDVIVCCVVY